MNLGQGKTEKKSGRVSLEERLLKLKELQSSGEESLPEFEAACREAVKEIDYLLGELLGMVDSELAEDGESLERLAEAVALAEFLNDSELSERIANLSEIYA